MATRDLVVQQDANNPIHNRERIRYEDLDLEELDPFALHEGDMVVVGYETREAERVQKIYEDALEQLNLVEGQTDKTLEEIASQLSVKLAQSTPVIESDTITETSVAQDSAPEIPSPQPLQPTTSVIE